MENPFNLDFATLHQGYYVNPTNMSIKPHIVVYLQYIAWI